MRLNLAMTVCIFIIASCGTAANPPSSVSIHATSSPSASLAATASLAPSAAPTPAPASPVSAPPSEDALVPGRAAITIVDGVRVRSAPSVDDAVSRKYAPLLPRGTMLFVLGGPTAASGYEWWEVVPTWFSINGARHGWVAAASREGEVWIQPAGIDCPPTPVDLAALKELTDGMALACFARKPITVRARLVSCNCDIDGPPVDPAWLGIRADADLARRSV